MSVYQHDEFDYQRKGKAGVWMDDEIESLVQFYKEEIDETPLFGKYRPIQSYYNISKKLKAVGYNRSPHQVRNKMKAMKTNYYSAKRGTDLDRQHCFMYEELDKFFRDRMPPESGHPSADDLLKREFEDSNITSDEIATDFMDNCGDCSDSQMNSTAKRRRTNIKSKVEFGNSLHNIDLATFMKDQLEKQRQHQLEITKIFTNAMTEQFDKFSNLITNLTQQMVDIVKRTSEVDEDGKIIETIEVPGHYIN